MYDFKKMRLHLYFFLVAFFICWGINLHPQVKDQGESNDQFKILKGKVIGGDTLPHVMLKEVVVIPSWKFASQREYVRYSRLVHNIKVTLPYARIASGKLLEINNQLAGIKGDKARKKFLNEAEKKLFEEFESPLRKLTFSQGKLLIRLIDRETGNTSYELIRLYKGKVSAFFWQGIARIFGANLKDEYDPDRDDKMVEHIILLIDNGLL